MSRIIGKEWETSEEVFYKKDKFNAMLIALPAVGLVSFAYFAMDIREISGFLTIATGIILFIISASIIVHGYFLSKKPKHLTLFTNIRTRIPKLRATKFDYYSRR